jgi:hypothetical protein
MMLLLLPLLLLLVVYLLPLLMVIFLQPASFGHPLGHLMMLLGCLQLELPIQPKGKRIVLLQLPASLMLNMAAPKINRQSLVLPLSLFLLLLMIPPSPPKHPP